MLASNVLFIFSITSMNEKLSQTPERCRIGKVIAMKKTLAIPAAPAVAQQGPPSWAPAHGYRDNDRHDRYDRYDRYEVRYDRDDRRDRRYRDQREDCEDGSRKACEKARETYQEIERLRPTIPYAPDD